MKTKRFFQVITIAAILLLTGFSNDASCKDAPTPYVQLQQILTAYRIDARNVIDSLKDNEIKKVRYDIAAAFQVPVAVIDSKSTTVGNVLTDIMQYKYERRGGAKWNWQKIQYSTDLSDYFYYLILYPNSRYTKEAKAKFIITGLYSQWKEISADPSEEMLQLFCDNYEEIVNTYYLYVCEGKIMRSDFPVFEYEGFSGIVPSIWKEEAQEILLEYKNARKAWEKALVEDTHDAFWDFYVQHPRSDYADSALHRVKEKELLEWKVTVAKGTRDAYENFIGFFPKGYYSNKAYDKIVNSYTDTTTTDASIHDFRAYSHYDNPGHSLIGIGNISKEKDNNPITVTLTGEVGYRLVLAPGEYKWLEVKDGDYKVLAESGDATPYWGTISCSGSIYAEGWFKRYTVFGHFLFDDYYINKEFERQFENAVNSRCLEIQYHTERNSNTTTSLYHNSAGF